MVNDKESAPPAYDAAHGRAGPSSSRPGSGATGGVPPSALTVHSSVDQLRTEDKSKQLVCTDVFINRDVDAMNGFLLEQMKLRPPIICHIFGKHSETRYEERIVENTTFRANRGDEHEAELSEHASSVRADTRMQENTDSARRALSRQASHANANGHLHRTQVKQQVKKTEEITAFDFAIELSQYLLEPAELWTAADDEFAYRGGTTKELRPTAFTVTAPDPTSTGLVSSLRSWAPQSGIRLGEREPLVRTPVGQGQGGAEQEETLVAWIREYVERPGTLKEFEWTKRVEGWDFTAIGTAIKESIIRSGYNGRVKVTFEIFGQRVLVRPPGIVPSMNSNCVGNVCLWMLCVKPYLLCYYREGRWSVAGETWSFRRNGDGMREGEWFRLWENTISLAVERKLVSTQALITPWDQSPGVLLDGYAG